MQTNQNVFNLHSLHRHVSKLERSSVTLYGSETQSAYNNFKGISGSTPSEVYPEIIRFIALIKIAAARANYRLGCFEAIKDKRFIASSKEILDAIVIASLEVYEEKWNDQFIVDVIQGGAGTSLHMNANEVIASRANQILLDSKGLSYPIGPLTYPIHPIDHINASQSTNDVIPTAIRMAILSKHNTLRKVLEDLLTSLLIKAEDSVFISTAQTGRTHLQDAVPITPSQVMSGYASVIRDGVMILNSNAMNLMSVTLGATAVGTGVGSPDSYRTFVFEEIQELLINFKVSIPLSMATNYFATTNSLGPLVAYSSGLRGLAVEVTKIANDIRLMASGPAAGFGEYVLKPLQAGSSIMPGKVNPVIPEVLNQACYLVMGNDHCVSLAAQNGQLQLNVMSPVAFYKLMESINVFMGALSKFTEQCIKPLKLNTERIKLNLEKSYCGIMALRPIIGYDSASKLAKMQIKKQLTLTQLLNDKKSLEECSIDIDPEVLKSSLANIETLTIEPRD